MSPTTSERSVRISKRILDRYLLDDEIPVVATRRHWARLFEPIASAFIGLLVVAALSARIQQAFDGGTWLLWAAWFVLLGRAVWHFMEWHNEWFVATDRRMLMIYGLVTHKVAMMPLAKVTDMNYGRSLLGRMLGYGQFVLESAGQEQAMREITWVPDPDEKYRRICSTIFGQDPFDEPRDAHERAWDAFDEEVGGDPFEATFHDDGPSFADRFDPDVVRVAPGRGGRRDVRRAGARQDRRRRPQHWEPVEPHERPSDWTWVEEVAREGREATRRRVAIDPDPTPPHGR